jgi:hypothetical protein
MLAEELLQPCMNENLKILWHQNIIVPESNHTSIVSVPFSYSAALSRYLAGSSSSTVMYHHASLPFWAIIADSFRKKSKRSVLECVDFLGPT